METIVKSLHWEVRLSCSQDKAICLLQSLLKNQNKDKILFPYNFKFHFILLETHLEKGVVTVLDLRQKDPQEYADMTKMLQMLWKEFTGIVLALSREVRFTHPKEHTKRENSRS